MDKGKEIFLLIQVKEVYLDKKGLKLNLIPWARRSVLSVENLVQWECV